MPAWIGAAVQALGNGTLIALQWITGYTKPDVNESRQEIDDQNQIDKFNQEQADGKIEDVRTDLSDDAPHR